MLACIGDPGYPIGMAIRNAFDPVDPLSLGTPAYTSVQASLFNRLRKTRGKTAGDLGWLLVRLGQPDHREHAEACDTIMTRPASELAALSAVVVAARDSLKGPGPRELCSAILEVLSSAHASAALQAKAARR